MQAHCFCWWDKTYSETVLCQPFNANIFFHVDLQVISRPAPCLSLSPFHKPAKWSCTWPEQEMAAIVLVMQMMTLCQLMTWRWRCSDVFFFRLNSFTGAEKLQTSLHPPLYNHYYLNYCFGSIVDQMTNTDLFFRLPRWVQLYRSLWETSPLLCELSNNGLSGWFQVLFNATRYSFSKSRRRYSSFCRQLCRAEVWSALTAGKHKKCFKLHSTFQCHS